MAASLESSFGSSPPPDKKKQTIIKINVPTYFSIISTRDNPPVGSSATSNQQYLCVENQTFLNCWRCACGKKSTRRQNIPPSLQYLVRKDTLLFVEIHHHHMFLWSWVFPLPSLKTQTGE